MRYFGHLLVFLFSLPVLAAECDLSPDSLNKFEQEILRAAEAKNYKAMAQPMACILQMQSENEGMARYLAHSYLRPLLGGGQISGVEKDPRYKVISDVFEQLTLRTNDVVQKSFVTEFSRGEWRFYTIFCEQGDTQYCSTFLPDEKKVGAEPPLLAAASMMRLRKAYQVLKGEQREIAASRLKRLYKEIPRSDSLKRKFIDQIYSELFARDPIPLG